MSSSRQLSHRTKEKQEKYRRHIASLALNANNENEDRNVVETSSRSPSPPYNPTRSKIRYVAKSEQESKEPKEDEGKTNTADFKGRYRTALVNQRRTGRSLTRTSGSNRRSLSANSNGSQEPGRITPRSRPGRSLTRSTSIEGGLSALPTSRSLSANRPPVSASTSEEAARSTSRKRVSRFPARSRSRTRSESQEPEKKATEIDNSNENAANAFRMSRFRSRSKSLTRSSSQEPEKKTAEITGDSSEDANNKSSANNVSAYRPLSRRSPFAKLLAEKKASVGSLKKKTVGKSKLNAKIAKSTETEETSEEIVPVSSEVSEPKEDAATKVNDSPSEDVNVSVLSEENIEKHTNNVVNEEIVDEFGDPPLQEMESEVTVNTDLDTAAQNYLASNSLLATLVTSPVDEFGDPPLQEMESEVTLNTDLDTAPQNYLASNSLLATLVTSPVHDVATPISVVTSPVKEAQEEAIESDIADGNEEKQGISMHKEIANEAEEEKKESDDDEDTVPPALKAWDLANPEFANFTPSQDEDFDPVVFDKDSWDPESTHTKNMDEKHETESSEDKTPVSPPPVEKSTEEPSSPETKKQPIDTYDMFDTSSWAAGTVSDFSNHTFSKVETEIIADKNFVNMMKEEMKFRSLTDEEQKLMLEASEKINLAEEKAKEELNTIQKDDEPLIVQRSDSNSVEGSEANTGISLEERVKLYTTVEVDSDSSNSSDETDVQESSSDEAVMMVEYVGQTNDEDEEQNEDGNTGKEESPINFVAADDVPTLEIAASAASESSAQEIPDIPRTFSEFKRLDPPPPPPPPGRPKKKKRKKKKKSKEVTSEKKKIPLLPPPSEEKMKKWKDDQKKPQDFVAAMAEKLADSDKKTLDASTEYFHFDSVGSKESKEPTSSAVIDKQGLEVDDPKGKEGVVEENYPVDVANDIDQVEPEDVSGLEVPEDDSVSAFAKKVQLENEQAVVQSAEKNHLWKKEVDDAMGLVERLEEEYDNGDFSELESFPSPLSCGVVAKNVSEDQEPMPSTSQESKELLGEDFENANVAPTLEIEQSQDTNNKTDEQNKTLETSFDGGLQPELTVDVQSSPTRITPQESLFTSPKSAKAAKTDGLNEKTKASSSIGLVLTDSKMADKFAMASSAAANTFEQTFTPKNASKLPKGFEALAWFTKDVLKKEFTTQASETEVSTAAQLLLEDIDNFNAVCRIIADTVNEVSLEIKPGLKTVDSFDSAQLISRSLSTVPSGDPTMSLASSGDSEEKSSEQKRILLRPVILPDAAIKLSGKYLAANFVSFLFMASKLTKVPSPFGDKNPFLTMIVESSLETIDVQDSKKSTQELICEQLDGKVEKIFEFVYNVKNLCDGEMKALRLKPEDTIYEIDQKNRSTEHSEIPSIVGKVDLGKRFIVPECNPSPFEVSVIEAPRIVAAVLSFLGDPVAVCTIKKVNQNCLRIVSENEHTLMQDAVRTGGIDSKHRPAFWMHVTLEKSETINREKKFSGIEELTKLELSGEEGKWSHVIKRDVERSFGNMPPHKTGAKFQSDSIVAALVTWGQNRLMKRGVKGGGEPVPTPEIGDHKEKLKRQTTHLSSPPWSEEPKENVDSKDGDCPADTVSSWSDVSPKGSFIGSVTNADGQLSTPVDSSMEEIALSGNSLSADTKADLQQKLNFILHTLAASYEDIGYCQGMDYVVAHLLRNLQGTIRLKTANKTLPANISTASELKFAEDAESLNKDIDSNRVVEETIVLMIDTFFVNYNLKHMYWPELRCLKTCCRVFERLIQIKLPVLADHFEHHDLNIGLFALAWFQTLFLYLPSMPSATVCHMWDIWLVERSFKIFFRVGTAILFLSQPILLNHELEGMMTYLNTIPDATLLRSDILIPCALNIKVTNRLLQELEDEMMKNPN